MCGLCAGLIYRLPFAKCAREGLPLNVHRTKGGKFEVQVRVAGKPRSFGTYGTSEKADEIAREVRALRDHGGDLMEWRRKHGIRSRRCGSKTPVKV